MRSRIATAIALPVLALSLGASCARNPTEPIKPQNVLLLESLSQSQLTISLKPKVDPYENARIFGYQHPDFFPNYQPVAFRSLPAILNCWSEPTVIEEENNVEINRQVLYLKTLCTSGRTASVLATIPQQYSSGLTTQNAADFLSLINKNNLRVVNYPTQRIFASNCVGFVLNYLTGNKFGDFWVASETSFDLFYKSKLFGERPIFTSENNTTLNTGINYTSLRTGDVMVWFDKESSTTDYKFITHVAVIAGFVNGRPLVYSKPGQLPVLVGDIDNIRDEITNDINNNTGLDILRPVAN